MRKYLIALGFAVAAAPALAQGPDYDSGYGEAIARAIPRGEQVEAMAPVLDRVLGGLLSLDVGPVLDAVDPYARRPGYGVPGRTLREMGRRDDPYFEDRLRSSVYGTTAEMGRMMDSMALAAPAIGRSLFELQRSIGVAVEDYERRRGAPVDDEPYWDD